MYTECYKHKVLELWLPFPPSVNGLYKNARKGRVKTDRYKEWQGQAYEHLLKQKQLQISGEVAIIYSCQRPDKRKRDVSNLSKALSDFLVEHNIIEDDHLVIDDRPRWSGESGKMVFIEIFSIDT